MTKKYITRMDRQTDRLTDDQTYMLDCRDVEIMCIVDYK